MSDEQLAPTLENFDAIIAQNSAKAEALDDAPETQESPDADERDTNPGGFEAPDEQQEDADDEAPELEAEEPDEDDQGDNTETEQVEAKLRAPFKAFREALKDGRMTPQLMEAIGGLEIELDLPGGRTAVPVKELSAGYMRTARFHRELEKTRNDQARAQHIMEIERARTNTWRQDDGELERGLEIMGCTEAAKKMFWRWAVQEHQFMNASPQEQQRIRQFQHMSRERAIERARVMEMERELQSLRQQPTQQQDTATQHAYKYIDQNMDKALTAAFKTYNAGKVSDLVREQFVEEATAMMRHGTPLDKALHEAAELVADRFAERKELARQQHLAEEARQRPREASPRRAPPAAPPQRRNPSTGQYTNGTNRPKKEAPTAANFAKKLAGMGL